MWLDKVKKHYGDKLNVNWRFFSLEQVNSKAGPEWKVWEQPDEYESREVWAFRAAEAARRQGPEAFDRFHIGLLKARFEDKANLADKGVQMQVAEKVGLDLGQFRKDLFDRSTLKRLAEDHTYATERYKVFGTPTFVFENGAAMYLKLVSVPEKEVLPVFESLVHLMGSLSFVGEIKRPQPPWPQNVLNPS